MRNNDAIKRERKQQRKAGMQALHDFIDYGIIRFPTHRDSENIKKNNKRNKMTNNPNPSIYQLPTSAGGWYLFGIVAIVVAGIIIKASFLRIIALVGVYIAAYILLLIIIYIMAQIHVD